jgi:hypothetical protein
MPLRAKVEPLNLQNKPGLIADNKNGHHTEECLLCHIVERSYQDAFQELSCVLLGGGFEI